MTQLPVPLTGTAAARRFVSNYLGHLLAPGDEGLPSAAFRGGQRAADEALQRLDISNYAQDRNQSYPQTRRGASGLSPWIRHGFLTLRKVWEHVDGGPKVDVDKFRDELLWQEYSRHWYARLGRRTNQSVRNAVPVLSDGPLAWDTKMGCIEAITDELEDDGWLVNQTRMWLASHWSVRHGHSWQSGEDYFFRHLLDGSRAANRLGWQWVTGAGSSKQYGFSRWQVEKWAAGLCGSCELSANCPIEHWPDEPQLEPVDDGGLLRHDPNLSQTSGPGQPILDGSPEAVWITGESLGDNDPAMAANPDFPVVFVFDEPLLQKLQLSSKRLIFMAESLAELGSRRDLYIRLGEPTEILRSMKLATTFAPVPGWRTRSVNLDIVELYPWPWLIAPHASSIKSFSSWRQKT